MFSVCRFEKPFTELAPLKPGGEEEKFVKVTYNYYEQLNGYSYLKSLGIGFHFYNGPYYSALANTDVLDLDRKTIIHIPSVNSAESTKDKYEEVDRIIEAINDKDLDVTIGDRDIYNANKRETNRQNRLLGRAY